MLGRWLVHDNGELEMRRRVTGVDSRMMGVEQVFEGSAPDAFLATASAWFVSLVTVFEGRLGFCDGRGERDGPVRFVLYVPTGALVRMPVYDAKVTTRGFAGISLPSHWPTQPLAIAVDEQPASLAEFERALGEADMNRDGISADAGCTPRVVRARHALAAGSFRPGPVGAVARAQGWNAAVLSRVFSGSYAITPRAYCQRLRVHQAVMGLFQGLSISQVAFDAGFTDLSRFYRKFRTTTGNTPGRYRQAGAASRVKKSQDAPPPAR